MNSDQVIQIFGLVLGSGIFITIVRIATLVGKYTTKLETLELLVFKYVKKVDRINENVLVLLTNSGLLSPKVIKDDE